MGIRCKPERTERPPLLFFAGHGDGPFGTDKGADPAAFAEFIVDHDVACFFIPGDAEIRAEVAAEVAAAAEIVPKAPACLHDRCLFVKTRFDVIQVFGMLLLLPVLDFMFAGFSHFFYQNPRIHRRARSARIEMGKGESFAFFSQ